MNQRKKLVDILSQNGERQRLEKTWNETQAAAEFAPLPPGEYTFRILTGELFTSKSRGTPGYKLTLEVTEGEHEGRRAWWDFWLTPAALPMTKRDLAKIGVTSLTQLEQPLPPGILIRGKLGIWRDDDRNESNRRVRFECIGIEPGDAFEPTEAATDQGDRSGQTAAGAEADEPLPFGANPAPTANGAGAPQEATP
jgi:hypothetical protein